MFSRIPSALALAVILLCASCQHHEHEAKAKPKYLVTTPLRQTTELTKEYVAQVRAIQHIELCALEGGYLQDVFVDEGQKVEKGQRMFQIMPLIYQAEVPKAQAEAELSEVELGNTRLLADKNIVSASELKLAEAKFSRARAELALASTHRGLTEIRAPFSGIMGRFQVRKGSLVDEGAPLTTLSDNSQVWVYFNVTEAEYLEYQAERAQDEPETVRLVMANGRTFAHPGVVQTIEADFNSETGNIAFRATCPNPDGLLRHGETGKVLMTTTLEQALVIPQKATFEVLDKKFVFVVDEKNVVHSRPIEIAAELPQLYVVERGLADSDKVLLDGLRKVREGSVIVPDQRPPAEVFAQLEVEAE